MNFILMPALTAGQASGPSVSAALQQLVEQAADAGSVLRRAAVTAAIDPQVPLVVVRVETAVPAPGASSAVSVSTATSVEALLDAASVAQDGALAVVISAQGGQAFAQAATSPLAPPASLTATGGLSLDVPGTRDAPTRAAVLGCARLARPVRPPEPTSPSVLVRRLAPARAPRAQRPCGRAPWSLLTCTASPPPSLRSLPGRWLVLLRGAASLDCHAASICARSPHAGSGTGLVRADAARDRAATARY